MSTLMQNLTRKRFFDVVVQPPVAPTFLAASSGSYVAADHVDPTFPAGLQPGDVVMLYVMNGPSTTPASGQVNPVVGLLALWQAGWLTGIPSGEAAVASVSTQGWNYGQVFTHVYTGAGDTPPRFSFAGSGSGLWMMAAYRGAYQGLQVNGFWPALLSYQSTSSQYELSGNSTAPQFRMAPPGGTSTDRMGYGRELFVLQAWSATNLTVGPPAYMVQDATATDGTRSMWLYSDASSDVMVQSVFTKTLTLSAAVVYNGGSGSLAGVPRPVYVVPAGRQAYMKEVVVRPAPLTSYRNLAAGVLINGYPLPGFLSVTNGMFPKLLKELLLAGDEIEILASGACVATGHGLEMAA